MQPQHLAAAQGQCPLTVTYIKCHAIASERPKAVGRRGTPASCRKNPKRTIEFEVLTHTWPSVNTVVLERALAEKLSQLRPALSQRGH